MDPSCSCCRLADTLGQAGKPTISSMDPSWSCRRRADTLGHSNIRKIDEKLDIALRQGLSIVPSSQELHEHRGDDGLRDPGVANEAFRAASCDALATISRSTVTESFMTVVHITFTPGALLFPAGFMDAMKNLGRYPCEAPALVYLVTAGSRTKCGWRVGGCPLARRNT